MDVKMKKQKRPILALAIIFFVNILVISIVQALPWADAAVYKQGSTGTVVKQIQQNLKDWGFYFGEVDGIYGSKTTEAVKKFQTTNGLKVDGITGDATLKALGISSSSASGSYSNELQLLARLISAEARGEPYAGQVAVGAVVLNRVNHPSFPNTMASVIYQKGAFSCIDDGQWNEAIYDSAYKAAQEALNGSDPSGGAIYYYNPVKATNQWIRSRPIIKQIGSHLFCS